MSLTNRFIRFNPTSSTNLRTQCPQSTATITQKLPSFSISAQHYLHTLESWFTNLEQTVLNRCHPLPAPYKRLLNRITPCLLFILQPMYLHNLSPHMSSQPITSRIYQRLLYLCLLYTSPSPRDGLLSRMPSSA